MIPGGCTGGGRVVVDVLLAIAIRFSNFCSKTFIGGNVSFTRAIRCFNFPFKTFTGADVWLRSSIRSRSNFLSSILMASVTCEFWQFTRHWQLQLLTGGLLQFPVGGDWWLLVLNVDKGFAAFIAKNIMIGPRKTNGERIMTSIVNKNNDNLHLYSGNLYMDIFSCA